MASAPLMLGTSSWRVPSPLAMSMARPRLMWSGWTSTGLPSSSANESFIAGTAASARTTAYPIRWVNETLPPRPRLRWLLMTMRLSMSSLAGMSRTLVAVGTDRLLSMLTAVRAAAPRSRLRWPSAWGAAGLAAAGGAAGLAGAAGGWEAAGACGGVLACEAAGACGGAGAAGAAEAAGVAGACGATEVGGAAGAVPVALPLAAGGGAVAEPLPLASAESSSLLAPDR